MLSVINSSVDRHLVYQQHSKSGPMRRDCWSRQFLRESKNIKLGGEGGGEDSGSVGKEK